MNYGTRQISCLIIYPSVLLNIFDQFSSCDSQMTHSSSGNDCKPFFTRTRRKTGKIKNDVQNTHTHTHADETEKKLVKKRKFAHFTDKKCVFSSTLRKRNTPAIRLLYSQLHWSPNVLCNVRAKIAVPIGTYKMLFSYIKCCFMCTCAGVWVSVCVCKPEPPDNKRCIFGLFCLAWRWIMWVWVCISVRKNGQCIILYVDMSFPSIAPHFRFYFCTQHTFVHPYGI